MAGQGRQHQAGRLDQFFPPIICLVCHRIVSPSLVADRSLEPEGRLGRDDRQAVVAVEVDQVADRLERSVLGSNLEKNGHC